MPFIPAPLTFKAAIEMTLYDKPVTNILHVLTQDDLTTEDMGVLAHAIGLVWETNFMALFSAHLVYQQTVLTDISVEFGRQVVDVPALPIPGGVSGDAMPANVAVVTTFRTGNIGRSRRGRAYLAGYSESNITGNVVEPTVRANTLATWLLLADGIDAAIPGALQCVVSKQVGGVPLTIADSWAITQYEVQEFVKTQKRRLPR